MRDATSQEVEIEEAILVAERTLFDLEMRESDQCRCEARWLEKMTRALRLALVAGVDGAVLMRMHLRLETSLRRATMLLAELDEIPASQRPTFRPPPGDWTDDDLAVEAANEAPPSQRPTLQPVDAPPNEAAPPSPSHHRLSSAILPKAVPADSKRRETG